MPKIDGKSIATVLGVNSNGGVGRPRIIAFASIRLISRLRFVRTQRNVTPLDKVNMNTPNVFGVETHVYFYCIE